MTSVTGRVPLDRIRPGRAVLVVVAALLIGLGWLACRAITITWLALTWCGSAVTEGWQSAKAGRRAP